MGAGGWFRVAGPTAGILGGTRLVVSGSPIPKHQVVERPRARGGWAWYLWVGDDVYGSIRGGPFATREEAEAALERRLRELDELYQAVEADAREHGYRVQW